MPVSTRSSSSPATRSKVRKRTNWVQDTTASARYKGSVSLSGGKKARQVKGSAAKASHAVSRATRARLPTSSSSSTRLEIERREPEVAERHHAPTNRATRSRSAATIAAPVEAPRTSSRLTRRTSVPVARLSRKRTVDALEEAVVPQPPKRRRTAILETHDAEDRALKERESALSEREDTLRKRELAIEAREELESTNKQLEKKLGKLAQKMEKTKAQSEQAKREWEARFEQSEREWEAKVKVLTDERDVLAELCEVEKPESVEPTSGSSLPSANLQWVLGHLEEHFQCSLCFEIMANPYSLNNGRCGHAYCAICILKWAFAAVHRKCGYWHEALECPLCRATLPLTPDAIPRNICTFPFVPDRLADAAIKSYLAILQSAADSESKSTGSRNGLLAQDEVLWHGEVDEQVMAWGQGKSSRSEWEQRERNGKSQMTTLFNNWSHYDDHDFVALKDRLRAT